MCLNPNWIKIYDMNHKFAWKGFFSILEEKKSENLSFKNGHFMTISGYFFVNYINIFHKTEIQMIILMCLVCKNFIWIKSYNKILVKISFFHAWKCIISGLVCRSEFWHLRRNPALVFSKWLFFQNSLGHSWDT